MKLTENVLIYFYKSCEATVMTYVGQGKVKKLTLRNEVKTIEFVPKSINNFFQKSFIACK